MLQSALPTFFHVAEGLQLKIDLQFVKMHPLPDAAAKGNGPLVTAGFIPVRGNDRGRGQILSIVQIVVNEVL